VLDLRPGVASFTRAAYHFELHGRLDDAREAMQRALESATSPDEAAFCRLHLDELEGRTTVETYRDLVSKAPSPEHLVKYGQALDEAGQPQEARAQYDLALQQLRALGGDDLTAALIAADHGDPAEALRFAEKEWAKRQSVFTADAMAWALHVGKRSAEALPYSDKAVALGWRDPEVLRHREAILGSLR
jgi:tetratricopeptide (TPR) repeat protein